VSQPERPFDARQAFLCDGPAPQREWRTVSLVTALREALRNSERSSDDSQREAAIEAALFELTARGIDGDSLVRYGMFPELVGAVAAQVVSLWLPSQPPTEALPEIAAAWLSILPEDLQVVRPDWESGSVEPGRVAELLRQLIPVIVGWIWSAPLPDLLRLTPPASRTVSNSRELVPVQDPEVLSEYRWAVERFSITHLGDWSVPSLHREYRWLVEQGLPPCPEALMSDRFVGRSALEAEISRRAVAPAHPHAVTGLPGVDASLSIRMQEQALQLLKEGRHPEAAALFQFALSQYPDDPNAENNLGFCLIPDAPSDALTHLDRAAALGYKPEIINATNRAVCHLLLGNTEKCLEVATEQWAHEEAEGTFASLWSPSEAGLVVEERVDARHHLAGLAARSAMSAGLQEAALMWTARAAA